MNPDEKILTVLQTIKDKAGIAPPHSVLYYRAGREKTGLNAEDEIMILNKLFMDRVIEIVNNSNSEYAQTSYR